MAPKCKSQSTTLETKKKQCVSQGQEAATKKTSFKQIQSTGKKTDYDIKMSALKKTADDIIAKETDTENRRLYKMVYAKIF